MTAGATIHAACVVYGADGILIRGRSGSGKSSLALALIHAAERAQRFGRLVADDRVRVAAVSGRLIAEAPDALGGLIEIRGVGLATAPRVAAAVVRLVVDLVDAPDRMPDDDALRTSIDGVSLPRLAVAARSNDGWSLVSQSLVPHFSEGRCGSFALAFAPQHEKTHPFGAARAVLGPTAPP